MSVAEIRKWLEQARQRLWAAKARKDRMKPNDPDRKTMVGIVTHRAEVKDRLVARLKRKLRRRDRVVLSSGSPHWGGCEDIIRNEVLPVFSNASVPITSGKRTETFGNPTSDHHTSQVNASARDAGTANNYALADRVGASLGIGGVDDYVAYYIIRQGARFRVQIIAGTHGTGPHLHVGIRRA